MKIQAGPRNLDDNIAIIGAGPAGVHMALLLTENGYKNITLIEKSDRVGGKSHTVEHNGYKHELGTAYLHPDYIEIYALLDRYGLNEQVPYLGRTVWNKDGTATPFEAWLTNQLRQTLPPYLRKLPRPAIALLVLRAIARYNRLHRQWFGADYPGLLPPKPKPEILEQISGSFADYLKQYNLQILAPILSIIQTVQGYGYLQTVPAFYGLMWNTPHAFEAVRARVLRKKSTKDFTVLTTGWQRLWETIVKKEGLDVWLNQDIQQIIRGEQINITLFDKTISASKEVQFDFLIVACPAPVALNFLDASSNEQDIFSRLKSATFTSTIYASTHQPGQTYLDTWLDELNPGHQHSLYSQRFTAGAIHPERCQEPSEHVKVRMAAQYGEIDIDDETLLALFQQRLDNMGAKNREIIKRVRFDYFYKFSNEDIVAGYPWKIFDLQGANKTWFIGSSVSFESVNNVVDYNIALMKAFTA